MDRERLEAGIEGIRHLLSHLHGEVTTLEESYSQVLLVLRRLESACDIDDLTKLLRRKAFFGKWNALLDECRKLGESCGMILVDIDHFKKINDTLGHPAGDEVIKRVSGILKKFESPACAVGRYGGEEFAMAVRGSEAEILGIAELVRKTTEQDCAEWKCTVSVGVAAAAVTGYDADKTLKSADEALYSAKNGGRNQVVYA